MRLRSRSKGAFGGIGAKLTAASGWTSLKGETDGRTDGVASVGPQQSAAKLGSEQCRQSLQPSERVGFADWRGCAPTSGTVRAAICRAGAIRTPKVQRLLTERALYYP